MNFASFILPVLMISAIAFFGDSSSEEGCSSEWWPPAECRIERDNPIEGHEIDVLVGGLWPSGCGPNYLESTIDGDQILFDITVCYPPETICLQGIHPWGLQALLGQFNRGIYFVLVTLKGCPGEGSCPGIEINRFVVSDDDGDVDLMDYQVMSACFESQGGALWSGCELYDLVADDLVDLADFAEFQVVFTGESP